jgi:tellurite resistance protein TerC
METSLWVWIAFNLFVIVMLALDLGVFHRNAHEVSVKEAGIWSVVWIALSLVFAGVIYLFWNQLAPTSSYTSAEATTAYLTGYIIEKSLSVDNIFVFVLLFTFFAIPRKSQHKVLFWGVIGALLMRGVMIFIGAALIKQFHWIIYLFGAFLIFTGIRMALHKDEESHPENNPVLRIFNRLVPSTHKFDGDKFFTFENGKRLATPLLAALVMIEFTDLIFAVDSIPAIFAVTKDPFIVYTSNIFAIMGLRSLYFVLADMIHKFHYLKVALSFILSFVGVKMLLSETAWKIPTEISLLVIAATLAIAIIASLMRARRLETAV